MRKEQDDDEDAIPRIGHGRAAMLAAVLVLVMAALLAFSIIGAEKRPLAGAVSGKAAPTEAPVR